MSTLRTGVHHGLVWGLEFGVLDLGFRVQGLGFRGKDLGLRVWYLGFRPQGLESRF